MSVPPPEYVAPIRGEQVDESVQHYDYADQNAAVESLPDPGYSDDTPLPVYIVSEAQTPEINMWSSSRMAVTDNPSVHVTGARANRTRLLIRNEGESPVHISRSQDVNIALAFRLKLDEMVELLHNQDVWARCATGGVATISVVEEYTVELDKHK
jgi:hypothetical protein